MKTYLKNVYSYGKTHPIIVLFVLALLLLAGWYVNTKRAGSESFASVIGQVTRGTLVSSVSGTGKLSPEEQYDMKPKASGEVTAILVRAGQKVKKGEVLVRLDTSDAVRAVRDAQVASQNAQVAMSRQGVQQSGVMNSVTPEETLSSAVTRMTQFYTSFAQIEKNLDSTLHDRSADAGSRDERNVDYYSSYDSAYARYPAETDTLYRDLKMKYTLGLKSLEVAKTGSDLDRRNALKAAAELAQTALSLSKFTMDLLRGFEYRLAQNQATHDAGALISSQRVTTQSDIQVLTAAYKDFLEYERALADHEQSLRLIPHDSESARLALVSKQYALEDARVHVSDFVIVAPIDGVVASVPIKVGDVLTTASVAVSVITEALEANLSLSEVDAARISLGQKATLTFDAFPDMTLTGRVVEKDMLGVMSQNVVSYGVKIAPDSLSERLLPNMSVSAEIITSTKSGVLMIPSAALRGVNGASSVQVPSPNDPVLSTVSASTSKGVVLTLPLLTRSVTTGAVGNTHTEILSGLSEADRIIVRMNKTGATVQRTIFQAAGGGQGGARGLGGGR